MTGGEGRGPGQAAAYRGGGGGGQTCRGAAEGNRRAPNDAQAAAYKALGYWKPELFHPVLAHIKPLATGGGGTLELRVGGPGSAVRGGMASTVLGVGALMAVGATLLLLLRFEPPGRALFGTAHRPMRCHASRTVVDDKRPPLPVQAAPRDVV